MRFPFLPKSRIENEALRLLAEYSNQFGLIVTPPIDVEGIIESLLGLDFRFDDLRSSLGEEVLGATWITKRIIRIDQSLDPTIDHRKEGRYRFTLAHEAGHWQLHRPIMESNLRQVNLFDFETIPSIICRSDSKDPIEWQADKFASYLLMPESMIRDQWQQHKSNCEQQQRVTDLNLTNSLIPLNNATIPSDNITRIMADIFKVSVQAMSIRLIELGILQSQDTTSVLFT